MNRGQGPVDLNKVQDLQDLLVPALFMAPGGASSWWRSRTVAVSTLLFLK